MCIKFSSYSSLSVAFSISKNFSDSSFTLINNSGADQSIINLNVFAAFTCTGIYSDIGSATSKRKTTVSLELVNNAYILAILRHETRVLFKINQVFCDLDPSQTEALLATH